MTRHTWILFFSILPAGGFGAIESQWDGSELQVEVDAGEDVVITSSAGNVKINGVDPVVSGTPTTVPAANVSDLSVTGDNSPQTLDVSAVTTANGFTAMNPASLSQEITLTSRGGDDVLVGSTEIPTRLIPGPGSDDATAGSGADRLRWFVGDGSDTADLAGGDEDIFDIEPEVVSPQPGTFNFSESGGVLFMDYGDPVEATVEVANAEELSFSDSEEAEEITATGLDQAGIREARFSMIAGGDDVLDASALGSWTQISYWYPDGGDDVLLAGSTPNDQLTIGPEAFFSPSTGGNFIADTDSGRLRLRETGAHSFTVLTDVSQVVWELTEQQDQMTIEAFDLNALTQPFNQFLIRGEEGDDTFNTANSNVDSSVFVEWNGGIDTWTAGGSGEELLGLNNNGGINQDTEFDVQAISGTISVRENAGNNLGADASAIDVLSIRSYEGDDVITVGELSGLPELEEVSIDTHDGDDQVEVIVGPVRQELSGWDHSPTGDTVIVDVQQTPFTRSDSSSTDHVDILADGYEEVDIEGFENILIINQLLDAMNWRAYE